MFFNDTATAEIYTLSLRDALPISDVPRLSAGRAAPLHRLAAVLQHVGDARPVPRHPRPPRHRRSEEHTSELQSRQYLVCRLLLEKNILPFFVSSLRPYYQLPRDYD